MRVQTKRDWKNILVSIGAKIEKGPPTLFITTSKQYVVYGMSWHADSLMYGAGFLYELADDHGNVVSAPMDVFDIVDDRTSTTWLVRRRGDSVFFWPELFFQKFFFDDLSEGLPEVAEAFRALQLCLENEDSQVRIGDV